MKIDHDWFAQYMKHVSANVKNRDGETRFDYNKLRHALDAVEFGRDYRVPQDVAELFRNIIGVLPQVEISERQETVLILALLNCHMAYLLVSEEILQTIV